MREFSLSAVYAWRMLRREWLRFVLPLLSLMATAVVLLLVLLLTRSSQLFLEDQAAELLGGDLEIESVYPVELSGLWEEVGIYPSLESKEINFSATIESASGVQAVSMMVVDNNFPLYGELILENSTYQAPLASEIYLSKAASERMGVGVGQSVSFGSASFLVKGIVVAEPASLLGGFRFLPRVFISADGFARANISTEYLRAEYEYKARFLAPLTTSDREILESATEARGLDVDFADDGGRLVRGLGQVTDFLMVAVIATAVLATVNVYASTVYLMSAWRRSFAVLHALGMKKRQLVAVVTFALAYIVISATILGSALSVLAFDAVRSYGLSEFLIDLPWPGLWLGVISTFLVLAAVSLGSLVPAVQSLLRSTPRQILMDNDESTAGLSNIKTLLINSLIALFPLIVVAALLLESLWRGFLILISLVAIYALVATLFYFSLRYLYRHRARFGFTTRMILAEKKAEGVFGVVSFTSLFVGLLAVVTVLLTQVSLETYLANDLSRTVPSVYVLDVQPSQKEPLLSNFSELTLFPNIGSRIKRIDNLTIEEELAKEDSEINRELGREFNLTFGTALPEGEEILSGEEAIGRPGTVSVDADFAERANIALGSEIEFVIQGVPLTVQVTNLRQTDSTSGLPFFYFILSPEDVSVFPAVYFGYAYYQNEERLALGQYVSRNMPNVSVLDTAALGPVLEKIIGTLLIIVYVIAVPPLMIALLLISTLIVLSYANRRREASRMRALGATVSFVRKVYLLESSALSVVAMFSAYLLALLLSGYLVLWVLDIPQAAFISRELLIGALMLILLVLGLSYYLFTTDRVSLRQLLAYEDGH